MKTNYNKYKLWCVNKHEWEKDEWHIIPDGRVYNPRFHRFYRQDTHILIQNTGILFDVNGEEIYEGYTLNNIIPRNNWLKGVVTRNESLGGWCLIDSETGESHGGVLGPEFNSKMVITDRNPESLVKALKKWEVNKNEQKSKSTF